MITLSAFADEIAPDLDVQMDVCAAQGIKCIDVRAIDRQNVSAMTVEQVRGYRNRMADRGFSVPCIGSPIGKIRVDEDMPAHLDLLRRCCDNAHAFGTKFIRIFSFYAPQGAKVEDHRQAVMDRMAAMVALAQERDVVLMHENESHIYGSSPRGVLDLFATIRSERFKGIFDPANFVSDGFKPYDDAWTVGLNGCTDYFHIKDKTFGAKTCVPAGEGDGQIPQLFADLARRNWSGYMTLEPHMKAAGQFSGFTGPDLFGKAVAGLKRQLDIAGLKYV